MSKVALITGILGQDGSYLADLLLEKGYNVHGIVRKESNKNNEKLWRIKKNIKNLTLHEDSLDSTKSFKKILEKIKPTEVYHLAAQGVDGHSFNNEFYTFENNINTTHIIISSLKNFDNKIKFFFAGSSEMYGNISTYPQDESAMFDPISAYGISKLTSYHLVKSYRINFNFFGCSAILFNHESPRRGPTFVTRKITRGLNMILKGDKDKLILGNLNASRDWGHAKDYVEGMWRILQQDEPDDFVLATNELHNVRDFVEKAFLLKGFSIKWKGTGINEIGYDEKTGRELIFVSEKYFRPAEVELLLGDCTKAKTKLGWEKKYDFDKLVKEMVDHDCV